MCSTAGSSTPNFYARTPTPIRHSSGRKRCSQDGETYASGKKSCESALSSLEVKLGQVTAMLTDQGQNLRDLGDKTAALSVQIENLQGNLKSLEESLGTLVQQSSSKRPSFRVRTPAELSVSTIIF